MARAYSVDLRERVVAAFCAGASCRWVAAAFKVSPASVVKWAQRQRDTGSVAPNRAKPRPRSLAEHRDWLMARLEAVPDLTLRGLVAELGERGIAATYGSVWRIVHDAGTSFKKNPVRRRAGPPGRSAPTAALDRVARQV